jgi:membrane-associated phospholipid phosphatase
MVTALRDSDTRPSVRRPAWRDWGARRTWRALGELLLIGLAALAYSLVRGLTDDRVDVAFANAEQIIAIERTLGIFVEPTLQQRVLAHDLAPHIANAIYLAYWPILFGTLVWLLIWRADAYALFRNALLASGALTLVVFALYPLAPPRFLPEYGFVDTIAANSPGYRDFNASAFVNEYAAMPSLHFGWVLLASIVIISMTRHWSFKVAAGSLPILMGAAIVVTGNHYILDAAVGAAVVLAGLGVAFLIRYRSDRDRVRQRRP